MPPMLKQNRQTSNLTTLRVPAGASDTHIDNNFAGVEQLSA
jgi:hypothetical protein